MIAKSLTAAFVSMSAAAGVVWVGTPTDDAHPHRLENPTAKETIDHMLGSEAHKKVETPIGDVETRMAESRVEMSQDEMAPTRDLPKSDAGSEDNGRRWLDKYLSDSPKDGDVSLSSEDDDTDGEIDRDVEVRVVTNGGQTVIEATRREVGSDSKTTEKTEKSVIDRVLSSDDVESVVTALENGKSMTEAMQLVSMETSEPSRVAFATPTEALTMTATDQLVATSLRTYAKAEPSQLLETTKLIDDDDLRDQALFSILTYALRFDDFVSAKSAMTRIGDDTLASNARARIAIRQAELGDIATALRTIETIEDEELQDIIRVQMIETLTTPLEKRAEP